MTAKAGFARRHRLEIVCSILLLHNEGPRRKTQIMKEGNLSFLQLQRYLDFLTEKGLISHDGGLYRITGRGTRFLEAYRELEALLA